MHCRIISSSRPRVVIRYLILLIVLFAISSCNRHPRNLLGHNFILINIDSLRADHLGFYGYGRDTSPFLDTLAEAASAVGLWPAAQPDEAAHSVLTPLVRRPLPCPEQSLVFSLTATIRDGRFTRISVFDEAPDWR